MKQLNEGLKQFTTDDLMLEVNSRRNNDIVRDQKCLCCKTGEAATYVMSIMGQIPFPICQECADHGAGPFMSSNSMGVRCSLHDDKW